MPEPVPQRLRVLFVDDDPYVLSGLRRMLYLEADSWEAQFATGPGAALKMLANDCFDVVVADMRMPVMDGAELLARVREMSPATVRIVLSGQTERGSALKAASVAHQFLSKPTDTAALKNAVSRGQELERRLSQASLRSVLGGVDRLPSPSATIRALNDALADPASDIDTVVGIVGPDLGLCSKVLQLVNSAFFALPREVVSIREAVAYLGLENLRGIAISAEAFHALGRGRNVESFAARLQSHSFGVMQLARHILPRARRPADLFMAGLLHDIGMLAAAALMGPQWGTLVGSDKWDLNTESQVLGTTHADIGAYLLCLWGMPYGAVEAVARHHDPGAAVGGALQEPHAVYLAEALLSEVDQLPGHTDGPDHELLSQLGTPGQVDDWRRYRDTLTGG